MGNTVGVDQREDGVVLIAVTHVTGHFLEAAGMVNLLHPGRVKDLAFLTEVTQCLFIAGSLSILVTANVLSLSKQWRENKQ